MEFLCDIPKILDKKYVKIIFAFYEFARKEPDHVVKGVFTLIRQLNKYSSPAKYIHDASTRLIQTLFNIEAKTFSMEEVEGYGPLLTRMLKIAGAESIKQK